MRDLCQAQALSVLLMMTTYAYALPSCTGSGMCDARQLPADRLVLSITVVVVCMEAANRATLSKQHDMQGQHLTSGVRQHCQSGWPSQNLPGPQMTACLPSLLLLLLPSSLQRLGIVSPVWQAGTCNCFHHMVWALGFGDFRGRFWFADNNIGG